MHEKQFYYSEDNRPVIVCLKIQLVRNYCVSYFKVNFSHCLHLRGAKQRKKKGEENQTKMTLNKVRLYGASEP